MKQIITMLIFALLSLSSQAQTVYVKSTATGNNTGTSWANACTSLYAALNTAATGSQIWVAAGTYYPPSSAQPTQGNPITDKSLTIYGGFPAGGNPVFSNRFPATYPTIISGDVFQNDTVWTSSTDCNVSSRADNTYNVFVISATGTTSRTVTFDGLIIQSGNAKHSSAGQGRYGAGIYISKSSSGSSTVTVNATNCTFRYNTAGYCAGIGSYHIYTNNGTMNINANGCKFYDNSADGWTMYGHVYAATNAGLSGNIYLLNNAVYRNYARSTSGNTGIVSLTCTGNTTSSNVEYHAHFNTFADNIIAGSGGGVICAEGPGNTNGNSALRISNNIFWDNSGKAGVFKRSGTGTAFVQASAIDLNMAAAPDSFITTGKDNIFGDPKFENTALHYRLSPCSPAINSGSTNLQIDQSSSLSLQPGNYDAERNTRWMGGMIDRGAYEFFGTASGPSSSSVNASICPGTTYTFDGQNLSSAGTYRDTIPNWVGCDSVITLSLTLRNSSKDTFPVTICQDDSFSFNNVKHGTAGLYTVSFTNAAGCDSIRTLNLSVNAKPQPVVNRTAATITVSGGPFDAHQWYLNGNMISGANASFYAPSTNGNYSVKVGKTTNSVNCEATSADFSVGFVGMKDLKTSRFNYYPNPATSTLTIETDKTREIIIMNLLGEVLIRERVNQKANINLQHLPKGLYLLADANKSHIMKFIIQ